MPDDVTCNIDLEDEIGMVVDMEHTTGQLLSAELQITSLSRINHIDVMYIAMFSLFSLYPSEPS